MYKSFGEKKVLKDFSLSVQKGEKVALMGESGSGKTTVFRIVSGIYGFNEGVFNKNFSSVSFLFQEDRLCEDFSAVGNIKFAYGKKFSKKEVEKDLLSLGLKKEDINIPVKMLSGGMKRRVAILRTVLSDAELVLLDEPFKGLDSELKEQMTEFVKEKTKDKTVMLITHDTAEAESLCDKIITVKKQKRT